MGRTITAIFFKKRMIYMLHDAQRHPVSHFSLSNFFELINWTISFFYFVIGLFYFQRNKKEIFNDRFPQKNVLICIYNSSLIIQ